MRSLMLVTVLGAATLMGGLPTDPAHAARFHDPSLQPPSLVEDVACRTVRSRIVRPGGRVVYRTKRVCTPGWRGGWSDRRCRVVRERIVRPGGAVVYRSVRRCR